MTGHRAQKDRYAKTAADYLRFWTQHAVNTRANPRHTMLQYDSPNTHGTCLLWPHLGFRR